MKTGTIITHVCQRYDKHESAKQGIYKLLRKVDHKDVLELIELISGVYAPAFSNSLKSYVEKEDFPNISRNQSIYGLLETEDSLKFARRYERIILCGGYFGRCHEVTFKHLTKFNNIREIVIPVEACYASEVLMKNRSESITLPPTNLAKNPDYIEDYLHRYENELRARRRAYKIVNELDGVRVTNRIGLRSVTLRVARLENILRTL